MKKAFFTPILLAIALLAPTARAQPPAAFDKPVPLRLGRSWRPSDYSWLNKPWVRDDVPTIAVKKYIDAAIQRHEVTKQTITDYEIVYHRTPSDPVAVFQWAYAAYHGGRRTLNDADQYHVNRAVDEALAQLKTPYTYEMALLRFLVEADVFPDPKLALIGERLLVNDPKNRSVKARTALFLGWSHDAAVKTKGLKYAQELLKEYPSEPTYHHLVASCYDAFCGSRPNPVYAPKAIAEYKLYLHSLPPGDPAGRTSEFAIQRLQNGGKIPGVPGSPAVPTAKP